MRSGATAPTNNHQKKDTYDLFTNHPELTPKNRSTAAEVYKKYKAPFLSDIPGAESKKLWIRNEEQI